MCVPLDVPPTGQSDVRPSQHGDSGTETKNIILKHVCSGGLFFVVVVVFVFFTVLESGLSKLEARCCLSLLSIMEAEKPAALFSRTCCFLWQMCAVNFA